MSVSECLSSGTRGAAWRSVLELVRGQEHAGRFDLTCAITSAVGVAALGDPRGQPGLGDGTCRVRPGVLLDEAGRDYGADRDEDEAAEELASLPGPGADLGAQFQADEGQGDADGADGDGGDGEADVEGAEGGADA